MHPLNQCVSKRLPRYVSAFVSRLLLGGRRDSQRRVCAAGTFFDDGIGDEGGHHQIEVLLIDARPHACQQVYE